jgi:hypothetical protein
MAWKVVQMEGVGGCYNICRAERGVVMHSGEGFFKTAIINYFPMGLFQFTNYLKIT